MSNDLVLSVKDTAETLGVHYKTVYNMCRNGEIKHVARVGTHYRINVTKEYPELELMGGSNAPEASNRR